MDKEAVIHQALLDSLVLSIQGVVSNSLAFCWSPSLALYQRGN